MKKVPANGIKGHLLDHFNGTYSFRVYDADHNFKDYRLQHSDLMVMIVDSDATLYENSQGETWLDHSPETLGQV